MSCRSVIILSSYVARSESEAKAEVTTDQIRHDILVVVMPIFAVTIVLPMILMWFGYWLISICPAARSLKKSRDGRMLHLTFSRARVGWFDSMLLPSGSSLGVVLQRVKPQQGMTTCQSFPPRILYHNVHSRLRAAPENLEGALTPIATVLVGLSFKNDPVWSFDCSSFCSIKRLRWLNLKGPRM